MNDGFAVAPSNWTGAAALTSTDFSIGAGDYLGVYMSLETGLIDATGDSPKAIKVGDGYGTFSASGDFSHTFSLAKNGPVFGGTLGTDNFNFSGLGVSGNHFQAVPEPSPIFLSIERFCC